jgi:hypothetical protein
VVLQNPSRKYPVMGLQEQFSKGPPKTLIAFVVGFWDIDVDII